MASLNRSTIMGNITRDAEIRDMKNGKSVANFSVATNESWYDKQTKEKKEQTEYHNIVVFNQNLMNYVKATALKGNSVYLEGKLVTRKYTGNDGVEKKSTEVVVPEYSGDYKCITRKADRGITESTSNNTPDNPDDVDDVIPF